MSEVFKFKTIQTTVPDLSGIKGFGVKQNEHSFESDGGSCTHCGKTASELFDASPRPEVKPTYFAPQASIIRLGADVAVKVIVQTLIRDEKALEELREKVQSAAYQIERHIQERLDGEKSVQEAGDMDRDPSPR